MTDNTIPNQSESESEQPEPEETLPPDGLNNRELVKEYLDKVGCGSLELEE